jgi:thymidylate synthase
VKDNITGQAHRSIERPKKTRRTRPLVHSLAGETVAESWLQLLFRVRKYGTVLQDNSCVEIHGATVAIASNVEVMPWLFEGEQIEAFCVELMQQNPPAPEVSDSTSFFTYAYRLRKLFGYDAIGEAIAQLAKNDTAKVTIPIYDSASDRKSRYAPSLSQIDVQVSNNEVILSAFFRDLDLFADYRRCACWLFVLRDYITNALNRAVGSVFLYLNSCQLYSGDWEKAGEILAVNYKLKPLNCCGFGRSLSSEDGYFVVTTENSNIQCLHYSRTGKLAEYSGTTARQVYSQIVLNEPILNLDCAFYLGKELARAQAAIASDSPFFQNQ